MRILTLYGIDIRIDKSFWLLPAGVSAYLAWQFGVEVGLRGFVLILGVFACVIGHELCHSLCAMHFGVRVPAITLYPMGGVASLLRIPKKPAQEFWIALSGPAFNFLLAAALYAPLKAWLGEEVLANPSLSSWGQTISHIYWVNPVLGFFNLLPAFPMDGGRVLRSLLAMKLPYSKATRISVFWGQFFAILFFLFGIWKGFWMLTLVGAYVYFAAEREKRIAQYDATIE